MLHTATFSFYPSLTPRQKDLVDRRAIRRVIFQNTRFSVPEEGPCPFLVLRGRLRGYLSSDEGKEVTLFRMFPEEEGLLSGEGPNAELVFEAEIDAEVLFLPPAIFQQLRAESPAAADFVGKALSVQFSQTLLTLEKLLWTRFDLRLADFLLAECQLEASPLLELTHEQIAAHLGTAREVVTRTLRRFQQAGLVELGRGWLKVTDADGLEDMADR